MALATDTLITLDSGSLIEVRDLESREIAGRVIPYGQTINVRGRSESFVKGALRDINPSTVKLLAFHDPNRPIGKMVQLEERDDGAYAVYKVSRTRDGDEMLQMAADGLLSFSPGFITGEQSSDGVHRRLKAMPETSLVAFAAYPGAQVLSVREEVPVADPVQVTTEPVELVAEAIDLSPLETRLDEVTTRLETLQASVDAPPASQAAGRGPRPIDWFAAQVDAVFNNKFERRDKLDEQWESFKAGQPEVLTNLLQTRALADITGVQGGVTNLDALVVEEFITSQLVNVLDVRRPLLSKLGSFPMPRSGHAKIPIVTQHTLVGERPTQKAAANSRKMIMTTVSFDAVWYDGAVDISLELIRSGELPILQMVLTDLLGQYALTTEGAVATFVNAGVGFTSVGAVLATGSYAAFALQVATQAIEVFEDSGVPATSLAVTKAQWPILLAMVDGNDRRQFASNPQNSDAQVALNATSFTLPGGIDVFYGPGLTSAVLFNQESLRVADGGPEQVGPVTNVELMGQDVGVLGRVMIVPRIPAAVRVFKV